MQLPLEDGVPRPRPLVAVALAGLTVLVILVVVPLLRGGPEVAGRQGGSRSLRNPTLTLADQASGEVDQADSSDPASDAALPVNPAIDPATFLPRYADSVLLPDLETVCNSPAPDDAIFVATDGDDDNPGTEARPLRSISVAVAAAEAGDTVLIRGGEYNQSVAFRGKFGTPDAYITLRAYPGERAVLAPDIGRNAIDFRRGNAYINVACLELAGPTQRPEAIPESPDYHRNRSLEGGNAETNPGNYGSGISIGDRVDTRDGFPTNHHIRIVANTVHDFAEAGIAALESNHISAIGNRTYRNAKYGCHSSSGISFGYLLDAGGPDNPDGYSNYIIGNVAYENENLSLQCFTDRLGPVLTDGNGIIVDQNDLQGDRYTARTLIADNVVYGNGGRGILVFESSRVDVINNVSYRNVFTEQLMGRDGPHAEIAVADANDVLVYNNIAVPRTGNVPFEANGADTEEASNLFRDPGDGSDLFVDPAMDGTGDFALQASVNPADVSGTPYLAWPGEGDRPALLSPVSVGAVFNQG
ncbi:MAG: right-handed parallel beta-helix repeat-containing protein [Actinomycetota bacterium]